MGEVLNNGVYLPDRGERNAYDGLKGNWNTLDSIAGKVPGYDGHISDTDIHVTAADKQTWNGKADASHVHNADDVTTGVFDAARIPNLDASKITTGTIDIARLPQGALERLVKVADQAARYALTASDVQLGDTVQQLDTGVMYVVTDETKLDSADGYTEYTAGSATSVPWSGVTGKPADYTPASHSHGNITNDGKVGTTANKPLITGTGGVVQAGSFGNAANTFCEGNDSRLSDARTPVAHAHTKSDVTDLLNSNFIPSANNSYDLGSSTNQWRKIYSADVVHTSGDETITGVKTLIGYWHLQAKNLKAGEGETYGRTGYSFIFTDKNDVTMGDVTLFKNANAARTFIRIRGGDYYTNGAPAAAGTLVQSALIVGTNVSGKKIIECDSDIVYPTTNNATDLGTSTNKWKTLNGVNPGALSLPDYAKAANIDTTNWNTTGTKIDYTPPENCLIQIVIHNDSGNKITVLNKYSSPEWGNCVCGNGQGNNLFFEKLLEGGRTYYIYITDTNASPTVRARYVPLFGNV